MDALTVFEQLSGHHRINGRLIWGIGTTATTIIDPATELKIGDVVDATAAEIDQAVKFANSAQQRWRKVNYHKRSELLHEAARPMRDAKSLVGEMLTREMGKPFKESVDEVIWSSTATDYYAGVGRHEAGRVLGPVVDGLPTRSFRRRSGVYGADVRLRHTQRQRRLPAKYHGAAG